jgi:hypothetical protein
MHPDQFITQLATRLELPHLAFNEEHVCRLVLDNRYVIDLEWVEQDAAIHAYAVLQMRATELAPRFAELLAANLFGRGTWGAVLALDVDRDEVLLSHKFSMRYLKIEEFVQQFEMFVESVAAWTKRLDQHYVPPADEDGADASLADLAASGLLRV